MMEYCTIQDGAKLLGVSRPTVYKRIDEGKLNVYEVLGRPALKLSEVGKLMLIKRRKRKPYTRRIKAEGP